MYRLLMRAFPRCYAFNSVYAIYPFSLPEKTSETLTKLNSLSSYSFDLPKTPPDTVHYVNNYHACARILSDPENFKIWWGPAVKSLTGRVYMLSGDTQETTDQHVRLHHDIYGAKESFKAMWDCFETITLDLIKQKAFRLGEFFEMDAVREYVLVQQILTLVWVTLPLPASSRNFSIFQSRRRQRRMVSLPRKSFLKFWG
jgi:hypothetical protein